MWARINGSLREVWMRARVFESEFQISFLTFSHNDDQNISSECKSWKAHFNKLVQKMDWFTGSRYRKVQVWAQGWLSVACLRLLSLHPVLLVNLAEGTGLFPWGSSKSMWAVTEWLPLTHMYSRTIFLARGYVLLSSSETPAYLEPCGGVIPHRKAMVMLAVQIKQCEQAKNQRGPPHLLWPFLQPLQTLQKNF